MKRFECEIFVIMLRSVIMHFVAKSNGSFCVGLDLMRQTTPNRYTQCYCLAIGQRMNRKLWLLSTIDDSLQISSLPLTPSTAGHECNQEKLAPRTHVSCVWLRALGCWYGNCVNVCDKPNFLPNWDVNLCHYRTRKVERKHNLLSSANIFAKTTLALNQTHLKKMIVCHSYWPLRSESIQIPKIRTRTHENCISAELHELLNVYSLRKCLPFCFSVENTNIQYIVFQLCAAVSRLGEVFSSSTKTNMHNWCDKIFDST